MLCVGIIRGFVMKFGTFAAGLALTITLLTSGFSFAALVVTKEEFSIYKDDQRRKDLYQDIKQIENYIKTLSIKPSADRTHWEAYQMKSWQDERQRLMIEVKR